MSVSSKLKLVLQVGVVAAAFVVAANSSGRAVTAAPDPDSFVCFPTCASNDARMIAMAAQGVSSLVGTDIFVSINSPSEASDVVIGVFDGETGGLWDNVASTPLQFDLYLDPAGNMAGYAAPNLIQSWSGASMPDSAWQDFTVPNNAAAQAAPGNPYRYLLRIFATNPAASGTTYFKVRTDGSLGLRAKPFAFAAPMPSVAEAAIIYPSWPSRATTVYDGVWRFGFTVPNPGTTNVTVWDGDLDFGARDCSTRDTDDPDSMPFPTAFVVSPATLPEGVATGGQTCTNAAMGVSTGNPSDDTSAVAYVRTPVTGLGPSLLYRLFLPDGSFLLNTDPSGNSEWEQFVVDADPLTPFNRATMDHKVPVLPGGVYEVQVDGVDLSNLNAFRFEFNLLGLPPNGPPASEDAFYRIERYVWYDADRDGLFDTDEVGIPGVTVVRRDTSTGFLQYTVTDATGKFAFRVPTGSYSLEVVGHNFSTGQPLNGLGFTGGNGFGATGNSVGGLDLGSTNPYERRDFGYVRNTPPTAGDDLDACACSSAGGATINVLANDADIDGHTLSVASITQPTFGTATRNDNMVTYVPNAGYVGTDSFTYTVDDGHGGSATGVVRIDVLSNPPILIDDAVAGSYGQPTIINVLANDSNPSGGSLAVTSFTQGANGAVTLNGDGMLVYTPNDLAFVGEDEFTYTVVTECGESTAIVRINISEPPPPPPTCYAGSFTTYTPGGWGAKPSGNNPGALLKNNFSRVYPGGSVTIGSGTKTLTFTSASAIEVFLPLGGNPGPLSSAAINPKSSVGGPFIGHLLSLQLAADFSRAGVLNTGLGNMAMLSGPLTGQTVDQILALANGVAGGTAALPSGVSFNSLQDTLVVIIMNYHEGTVNGGLLGCGGGTPPPPPPPPPPVDPPPATGSGVCSGGVTKLVLKYIGGGSPNGVVSGQRSAPGNGPKINAQVSGSSPVLYTFATTDMGGLFDSVSGGRLANNFTLFVGNTKVADVHTSCSVPIYPGMKIGNQFEIVALWTRGAGLY